MIDLPAETISCVGCDAQEDGLCRALVLGWQDIQYDESGLSWNFQGTCPTCYAEQTAEARAAMDRDAKKRKRA